jgi:hypothetical protein
MDACTSTAQMHALSVLCLQDCHGQSLAASSMLCIAGAIGNQPRTAAFKPCDNQRHARLGGGLFAAAPAQPLRSMHPPQHQKHRKLVSKLGDPLAATWAQWFMALPKLHTTLRPRPRSFLCSLLMNGRHSVKAASTAPAHACTSSRHQILPVGALGVLNWLTGTSVWLDISQPAAFMRVAPVSRQSSPSPSLFDERHKLHTLV